MISLENLSLKKYLNLVSALVFAILLVVGAVGIAALQGISSSAAKMGEGKDVVADILPPPLFIIEAQLTAYDLAAASEAQRPKLLEKLQQLKKDYVARNQFWSSSELDADLKAKLLGEQKTQGELFWAELENVFLPALAANDTARMESSLRQMRERYEAHRVGVEATVVVANQFAESTLKNLTDTSWLDSLAMSAAIVIGCLLIVLAMRSLSSTLFRRIGGEPAAAVAVVSRIAGGDLGGRIELAPGDSSSMLAAMKTMQEALAGLVGEIRDMVLAAEHGDLGRRMGLADKQGFGREIGEALNQLMVVTDTSLQDVSRVAGALAAGDLSQKVDAVYPGAFGQTAGAINATVQALAQVIEEVREIVNAAAQGDFSRQIDVDSKRGYARTLAELLNSLGITAHQALSDISLVARTLADGDLRQRIERQYPGLFGETAQGINTTVDNLKEVIGNVVAAVDAITTAAKEISAGNADLSVRTEEQASSLEETAASIEEFTATAQQNTASAKAANELAMAASEMAIKGGEVVKASAATMIEIQTSSKKVGDIISVIEGIAFQTNILALNAAVEAARAGDQGKGFAVVATEVRALAQRSATAAKEIGALIADSGSKIERGSTQAREAGVRMEQIVESIGKVTAIVASISRASSEQTAGIEQVNQAVSQMDEVTQQNAALVEEAAAAAESLEDQAQQLQEQVARFKLDNSLSGLARLAKPQRTAGRERSGKAVLSAPADDNAEWNTI